jgi:hypothetical protein
MYTSCSRHAMPLTLAEGLFWIATFFTEVIQLSLLNLCPCVHRVGTHIAVTDRCKHWGDRAKSDQQSVLCKFTEQLKRAAIQWDACVYTRKNAQVVTNLQQTCSNAVLTTCQQDVFALLVPSLLTSCQRLVDKWLQGCWAEQTCYKLFQQLIIALQLNNFQVVIDNLV